MPQKDGTGPQGNGSRTGRGLGNCLNRIGRLFGKRNGTGRQLSNENGQDPNSRGNGQGQGQGRGQRQGQGQGQGRGQGQGPGRRKNGTV